MKAFPNPKAGVSILASVAHNFQLEKRAFDPAFACAFRSHAKTEK
jgi:hypothetical protein